MTSTMTISDIVRDPSLLPVLQTSFETRDQALALLALLETPTSEDATAQNIDISSHAKLLHTDLARLRGLNRDAVLSVRASKQATAEARAEVDRLHLHLQNLHYEQRHLQGEIAACESYDHPYLRLPLIPAEEYLNLHPEHASLDEHALMIARIEHEHAERELLEQERQGLLKKKQGLIADNKKRKDDLASLDADLEKFIDAAKPIQKMFDER